MGHRSNPAVHIAKGHLQIVGVAGYVGEMGLGTTPYPEIYLPFTQSPWVTMVLMIRTAGDPQPLVLAVRRRVAALDRNLSIQRLRPFTQTVDGALAGRRFSTVLLALCAGLLNYWVRVRQDEIAIRIALGAPRSAILRGQAARRYVLSLVGAGPRRLGRIALAGEPGSGPRGWMPPAGCITLEGSGVTHWAPSTPIMDYRFRSRASLYISRSVLRPTPAGRRAALAAGDGL